MQNLLWACEPFAYSSGRYGWTCDYCDVDDIIISTGYNLIGRKVNYDLVRDYENKTYNIWTNFYTTEEAKAAIKALLSEFVVVAREGKHK